MRIRKKQKKHAAAINLGIAEKKGKKS